MPDILQDRQLSIAGPVIQVAIEVQAIDNLAIYANRDLHLKACNLEKL